MMKTGILLLNFGGPESLDAVPGFLFRLFSDPRVLVGIRSPLRQLLAALIVLLKSSSSKSMYKSIGGKSPQLDWTKLQVESFRNIARGKNPHVVIKLGMLLSEPYIYRAVKQLKEEGAQQLVLLPLFCQYSTTTTQSCLDQVEKALKRLNYRPQVTTIKSWCDHPGYISLLRKTVDEQIEVAMNGGDPTPHVMFSAHSLPMKIVNSGDPYLGEVEKTVKLVTKDLDHSWSLAYQSKNGPIEWAKPYVEEEIPRLAKAGTKSLIIVPISFVCDHIETLFEIDQLYAQLAKDSGIANFYRSRCFNDDAEFPEILHDILVANQMS
jgi:ferrochelatase